MDLDLESQHLLREGEDRVGSSRSETHIGFSGVAGSGSRRRDCERFFTIALGVGRTASMGGGSALFQEHYFLWLFQSQNDDQYV